MNKANLASKPATPMLFDAAVLVIEPDLSVWSQIASTLSQYFGLVQHARTVELAVTSYRRFNFNLVIIDFKQVIAFTQALKSKTNQVDHSASSHSSTVHSSINLKRQPSLHSIKHTQADSEDDLLSPFNDGLHLTQQFMVMSRAVEADDILAMMRMGARDVIRKPIYVSQFEASIVRWCTAHQKQSCDSDVHDVERENVKTIKTQPNIKLSAIIGDSKGAEEIRANLMSASLSESSILIEGQTGTGKTLAVQQLVQLAQSPSLVVNIDCRDELQLTQEYLISSDDSVANKTKHKLIILNHVDGISVEGQIALLQLLASPLVNNTPIFRVISLSSRSLLKLVNQGGFSAELYYQLASLYIYLPPLKKRSDDIMLLIKLFVNQLIAKNKFIFESLTRRYHAWGVSDFQSLVEFNWPGNIKQLRSAVEQCLLMDLLPNEYFKQNPQTDCQYPEQSIVCEPSHSNQHFFPIEWDCKQIEKAHIMRVMHLYKGNRLLASEHLNVSRKTIDRKLNEWNQKSNG